MQSVERKKTYNLIQKRKRGSRMCACVKQFALFAQKSCKNLRSLIYTKKCRRGCAEAGVARGICC